MPDVSVSVAMVKRLLRKHQESGTPVNKAVETLSSHIDLNIACYSLGNNIERLVVEEQEEDLYEIGDRTLALEQPLTSRGCCQD